MAKLGADQEWLYVLASYLWANVGMIKNHVTL